MRFSRVEVIDLTKGWLVIALAFAIAITGLQFSLAFLNAFIVSVITVGTGFLLHEIAHKYFAQKWGTWAEFRANNGMLGLALLLSLFGIIFAVPGGVFIRGRLSKQQYGITALAGPVTNIILAIGFIILALILPEPLNIVGKFGAFINAILAVLNLLPFGIFDGRKVWAWSRPIWALSIVSGAVLLFGQGVVLA